jgi:RNA polymerase sigma-70 factor (ECF subfamily)
MAVGTRTWNCPEARLVPEKRNAITLSPDAINALVTERARFHRFLTRRLGNATEADDLLQESLLRALQRGDRLRRGERVVPWFYRILRNSVADHFRRGAADQRKIERLGRELDGATTETVAREWDRAVCACFEGLLPSLNPRYAEILRRIDLRGETHAAVARALKMSTGAFSVALHRARTALRRRLEVFCGACSREHCLACTCAGTESWNG